MQYKRPLFHIVKRKDPPWYASAGIRLLAVLCALLVCAAVTIILTKEDPMSVFSTVVQGAVGTKRRIWTLLQNSAILLCISLAVTPAFRMQFWNVGGEGQVLMGALATAGCMLKLGNKVPAPVLYPVLFLASMMAGAVWAFVPALFKALWKTNETLSTLMLNYIATQLVAYYVVLWENPKGSGTVGVIHSDTNAGWLPVLLGQKYLANILIVLAVLVFLTIYLNTTKHGYELSVVGESERTAKYLGINVTKVILRTASLSGALCGLAGLLMVAGTDHTITTSLAGGRGFTAVMVSWMSHFDPIMMVITCLFIVFLERGSGEIATVLQLNTSFSDTLTGIILFFLIGCEFFIHYRIVRSGKAENKEVSHV
ncbi:MAG: ABC transporter permease [Oscillospiraceae bacterium]|nr:ABC transporter permease [Oscillospiraceae bacterium]